MAEMEVLRCETPGIAKEIDEGAIDLVFDVFQEGIYAFPIKSFVREAISNGLDAIVEREIHQKIASGEPVDKYYRQEQDDKLLKDSAYDKDYYNDKYLSDYPTVDVRYEMSSTKRRHTIKIEDKGVGLGGKRLRGFFKIGYSSKRNLKAVFGKFGAGAKAGLATGVEYFIMRTVYNGYTTAFMIFKSDYEAITPESSDSKVETWEVLNVNGSKSKRNVYWQPTEKKNGVTIELEVKPHNRKKFIEAVTEQFQNFKGKVKLLYQDTLDGVVSVDELNEQPHYESDRILIPKESKFSVPTVLVDGINYGPISWPELEMENRPSNLCIKVHATDIDITQSRESLKWTEKTKRTIMEAIKVASKESNDYIEEKLRLPDPYDIFKLDEMYGNIRGGGLDAIISTFSSFLRITKVKPFYVFNPEVMAATIDRYGKEMMIDDVSIKVPKKLHLDDTLFDTIAYGYNIRRITIYFDDNTVPRISSEVVTSFREMADKYFVYAKDSKLTGRVANHILENFTGDAEDFIYIRKSPSKARVFTNARNWDVPDEDTTEESKFHDYRSSQFESYFLYLVEKYGNMKLDEQDFDFSEEEAAEDLAEVSNSDIGGVSEISLSRLRKLNEQVYISVTGKMLGNWHTSTETYEPKIVDIPTAMKNIKSDFDADELVCYTTRFKQLKDDITQCYTKYDPNHSMQYIRVSEENLQHVAKHCTFITDLVYKFDINTKKIQIRNPILQWAVDSSEAKKESEANTTLVMYSNMPDTFAGQFIPYFKSCKRAVYNSGKVHIPEFLSEFLHNLEVYKELSNGSDPVKAAEFCRKHFAIEYIDTSEVIFDRTFWRQREKFCDTVRPVQHMLRPLNWEGMEDNRIIEDLKLLINIKTKEND